MSKFFVMQRRILFFPRTSPMFGWIKHMVDLRFPNASQIYNYMKKKSVKKSLSAAKANTVNIHGPAIRISQHYPSFEFLYTTLLESSTYSHILHNLADKKLLEHYFTDKEVFVIGDDLVIRYNTYITYRDSSIRIGYNTEKSYSKLVHEFFRTVDYCDHVNNITLLYTLITLNNAQSKRSRFRFEFVNLLHLYSTLLAN